MPKFNFENAFMHFARTDAPRGFVWKFALAYVIGQILFLLVAGLLVGRAYMTMMQAAVTNDVGAMSSAMSGGTIALIYLVITPLSLLLYAVFEAAYLRRYIRKETFKLGLGGEELRNFLVLLIWFVFYIVAIIAAVLVVGVVGGAIGSGIVAFLLGLAVFIGIAYLSARFSPAAAMTMRDGQVRFASAWGATRGRGWALLGVYAVWFILGLVAYFVVALIAGGVMGASMAGMDPAALESTSFIGMIGVVGVIFYLLLLAAVGCFLYIWAGPAALAAKRDPNYSGYLENQAVFD